jgi:hypothetical protein
VPNDGRGAAFLPAKPAPKCPINIFYTFHLIAGDENFDPYSILRNYILRKNQVSYYYKFCPGK